MTKKDFKELAEQLAIVKREYDAKRHDFHQKNPHRPDTPEYQLFENMLMHESQASAFFADAERYAAKAAAARQTAERYRECLRKLEKREVETNETK
jgi:hypothetical protein